MEGILVAFFIVLAIAGLLYWYFVVRDEEIQAREQRPQADPERAREMREAAEARQAAQRVREATRSREAAEVAAAKAAQQAEIRASIQARQAAEAKRRNVIRRADGERIREKAREPLIVATEPGISIDELIDHGVYEGVGPGGPYGYNHSNWEALQRERQRP